MTVEWFDAHVDPDPPRGLTVWVATKSGIVATGQHVGWTWSVDGYLVRDSFDYVWYWANITYPQGPNL